MPKIFVANYEGGSAYLTGKTASKSVSATPDKLLRGSLSGLKGFTPEIRHFATADELRHNFGEHPPGSLFLSTDHAVSEGILHSRPPVDAVIVVDQHKDIYSYKTHGKELNKANVFRRALDNKRTKFVAFVGTRPSEAALSKPVPGLAFSSRVAAWFSRRNKIHGGHEDKIKTIPSAEIDSFLEGIRRAAKELQRRGFKRIGLEIDLDAFDSERIKGVDYNSKILDRAVEEQEKKFGRSGLKSFLRKTVSPSYWTSRAVNSFLRKQLKEPGINVPGEEELVAARKALSDAGLNLDYVHVTEFKPEHDENGETTKLVHSLIRAFHPRQELR